MSNSKSFNNSILIFDTLTSTNSYALQLIRENKAENKGIIVAKYQSQGRGQRTKAWNAEIGKSLLMSRIYLNVGPVGDQYLRSKCIALAVKSLLDSLSVTQVEIKWPNDILVAGKKIAGILVENSIEGNHVKSSVVGLGLNINQTSFEAFEREATSLKLQKNKEYECLEILDSLIQHLDYWENILENGDRNLIHSNYQNALYGVNRNIRFKENERKFEAKVLDSNEKGEIILLENGKQKAYQMHQITFMD